MTFQDWWDSGNSHFDCALDNYDACEAAWSASCQQTIEECAEVVLKHMKEEGEPCESCDNTHLSCGDCIAAAIRAILGGKG